MSVNPNAATSRTARVVQVKVDHQKVPGLELSATLRSSELQKDLGTDKVQLIAHIGQAASDGSVVFKDYAVGGQRQLTGQKMIIKSTIPDTFVDGVETVNINDAKKYGISYYVVGDNGAQDWLQFKGDDITP
jgi:hypothetical protein